MILMLAENHSIPFKVDHDALYACALVSAVASHRRVDL